MVFMKIIFLPWRERGRVKSRCHFTVERDSSPTSCEAIRALLFRSVLRRPVDGDALALPLGTWRLRRELRSFHSLNIIPVLMIKAGGNSMNRIDYSIPLTAGSSLEGPVSHSRCLPSPGLPSPASECGTHTHSVALHFCSENRSLVFCGRLYFFTSPT